MREVKTPKKPLLYYYIIAMLVLLLFNLLAMPWLTEHQIREVDYNTFVTMTEQKEIGQVEIQEQSNRILFTDKDNKTIYKTAIVPDDGLVQRLLDAGISARRITSALKALGADPTRLSAVLVTHEHTDHVSGLATLTKQLGVPVYATAPTLDRLERKVPALAQLGRALEAGTRSEERV